MDDDRLTALEMALEWSIGREAPFTETLTAAHAFLGFLTAKDTPDGKVVPFAVVS